MLTWDATRDEVAGAYPGDELLPDADGGATISTTLPGPPDRVWPWLVQMGGDRGGWYSWDWVDNHGEPSADRIVPEWQDLEEGRNLKGPTNSFTVAVLDPTRTPGVALERRTARPLLRSANRSGSLGLHGGYLGLPSRFAPGGRTRLVIRTRSRSRMRLFRLLVGEPVHFVMQTRQFHNLRTRIGPESAAAP